MNLRKDYLLNSSEKCLLRPVFCLDELYHTLTDSSLRPHEFAKKHSTTVVCKPFQITAYNVYTFVPSFYWRNSLTSFLSSSGGLWHGVSSDGVQLSLRVFRDAVSNSLQVYVFILSKIPESANLKTIETWTLLVGGNILL